MPQAGSSESRRPSGARVDRRGFLKTAAAGAMAVAAPAVVSPAVLGMGGRAAPGDRIVLGGIGIGNRGRGDLDWIMGTGQVQMVAVCDPNKKRREAVKKTVDERYKNNDCKMYSDIREYLAERTDIDLMLVTTGDRWHAFASILTMRAGKDVYSEKPSCMTIAEGQAVVDTAKRYGRVYQTGTQRLSEPKFVFAIELARSGRLGKVHTARAHIAPWDAADMRHDWLPPEPEPPQEEMLWENWLGPCPWRPYNSKYVWGQWRGHYDFHTSAIGEWGAHTFAQAQAGIDMLDTSPVHYQFVKDPTGHGMVTTFANGVKMTLSRGN